MRLSLVSGLGFALLFLVGLLPDPGRLIGLLTVHRDVAETSARYAPWLVPVVLFGSTAFMYDGLFLGLTEGRALRNAMAASMLGVFLPLALWSVVRGDNDLLWGSMAAFMIARSVTLAWSLARLRRGFAAAWVG